MAKVTYQPPRSMRVYEENQAKRKAWIRDAAIKLMATYRADRSLTDKAARDSMAYVAVESAAAVCGFAETREREESIDGTGEANG